jgi:PBP1b-binding outer membrane lipoprotein LpoB
MRKLILAAVAGTAFALAGCSEKAPETPAATADATDTGSADASGAADASSAAAADSSTAAKM